MGVTVSKDINAWFKGTSLNVMGQLNAAIGKRGEALLLAQESVAVFAEAGDKNAEGLAMLFVAEVYRLSGMFEQATMVANNALKMLAELSDEKGIRHAENHLRNIENSIKHVNLGTGAQQPAIDDARNKEVEQVPTMMLVKQQQEKKELVWSTLQTVTQAMLGADEEIAADRAFMDVGITSTTAVRFRENLQKELRNQGVDVRLDPTLVFDFPTINTAAEFIAKNSG